jgi:hypothetical protein
LPNAEWGIEKSVGGFFLSGGTFKTKLDSPRQNGMDRGFGWAVFVISMISLISMISVWLGWNQVGVVFAKSGGSGRIPCGIGKALD